MVVSIEEFRRARIITCKATWDEYDGDTTIMTDLCSVTFWLCLAVGLCLTIVQVLAVALTLGITWQWDCILCIMFIIGLARARRWCSLAFLWSSGGSLLCHFLCLVLCQECIKGWTADRGSRLHSWFIVKYLCRKSISAKKWESSNECT